MTDPDDNPQTRSFEIEIEVPGTPEEVWDAIATGPGITAWMHPTEVEEREGGRFTFDMGSGPRHGTVTGWDPPRRFAERTQWEASADAPAATIATEWTVEARAGGTCVVRMVMSGFASGADWDDEVDGVTEGMRLALDNLRRHLTHFPGERGAWARAFGPGTGSRAGTWEALTTGLGLGGAAEGGRFETGPDAPRLAGVVDRVLELTWHRARLLRLEEPAPGIGHVIVHGEGHWTTVQACFYGDDAAAVAAREEPAWQAWMKDRFPAPDPASRAR
jgi:uncharacterized protein YndB with AHSA1/START domain